MVCERGGNGRVEKGFNVMQGGAVGMILYNPTPADVETDNHWLPTVHLRPDGTQLLAFLAAHPGATATFTAGRQADRQGRRDGRRSPRAARAATGIKPDVTAPGVQILAGHTPTPDERRRAARPASTPGHRRHLDVVAARRRLGARCSRRCTRLDAGPDQVGADDDGDHRGRQGGRRPRRPTRSTSAPAAIDLTAAGDPGLTFDETAARMAALGADPVDAVDLNLPSMNAPMMPGLRCTTTRTADERHRPRR